MKKTVTKTARISLTHTSRTTGSLPNSVHIGERYPPSLNQETKMPVPLFTVPVVPHNKHTITKAPKTKGKKWQTSPMPPVSRLVQVCVCVCMYGGGGKRERRHRYPLTCQPSTEWSPMIIKECANQSYPHPLLGSCPLLKAHHKLGRKGLRYKSK